MKRSLLLMLLLVLAACAELRQGDPIPPAAATAKPSSADMAMLSAYHWRLQGAKDAAGHTIEALYVDAENPLQLDFIDGRIYVNNACNRMSGYYSVEGNRLKFNNIGSTLMLCRNDKLMALEREINKQLQGSLAFALRDDDTPTLVLTSSSSDVLTFVGEATAETRYGGPGETVFLEVAAQPKACSHPLIPDKQCLQVRELKYDDKSIKTGTDGAFENFYQDIEGYAHQTGTRNVLRVKRYTIKNPPTDTSALAYVLDMVVESESPR